MLAPETSIGTVALTVSDLDRSAAWYERALGLRPVGPEPLDGTLLLGGVDGRALLSLRGDPLAAPRNPRDTGLFHFAMLLPSRADLAGALLRLAAAREGLTGASDHLVSEALYLHDPDGNGIEIYRDRPRSEWRAGAPGSGVAVEMATLPLDLEDLVSSLGAAPAPADGPVPAGTSIGHVHLQVASLPEVEHFYAGVLGFDVMVRGYPGALFVSAGGYHHHIGLNTWNSRGGSRPPERGVGLRFFEVRAGSSEGVEAVRSRVLAEGLAVTSHEDGFLVADPSGNRVLIRP